MLCENRVRFHRELAAALGVGVSTISAWKSRGYTVQDEDGLYLVKETKEKVETAYGHAINAPISVRRRRSFWSHGPHCLTHAAQKSWQHLRSK
jgi:hypothetical protein